jgi:hypothetical protein
MPLNIRHDLAVTSTVSSDLLDGGRPKRLVLRQGRWYLEMSRLVSTGDGVFAPKTHRIEGNGAIVEGLRRSKHGRALADAAARLVARGDAGSDASYDAVDGSWVPSSIAPSYIKQLGRKDVRTPAEAALMAELTLLRAAYDGLVARVARLERTLSEGVVVRPSADRIAETWASASPDRTRGQDDHDERDDHDGDERRDHDGDGRQDGDSGPAAQEPPEVAAPPPESEAPKPLRLPGINVVTSLLKQLCGQEIPLKELKQVPEDWFLTPTRYSASWLVDDQGVEVGAMLCDVEAVARLGGTLLMLPQSEIDSQASAENPTEDVVSAASEICNNLSGPLNKLPGNTHVRSTSLERLDDLMPEWLRTPRAHFTCAHPGGGVLMMLSR